MSKYNIKDINQLENICNSMENMMQPMEQLGNLMEKLTDIALQAEKEGDLELLQFIFSKILPDMDSMSQIYQQFVTEGEGTKFKGMKKQLHTSRNMLNTFKPNCLIHIAADSTGNAGDYILVRSLRKLIEGKNPDINWYSAHIRDAVDDDYIARCNRSRGVLLGGGGFFIRDTNQNDISGWQWTCSIENLKKIKVPIYVMAVGYNRFRGQEEFDDRFRENLNALVEQSALFGLRNHGSIEAVRGYLREDLKDKVVYHPCATTVLSKMYQLPKREEKEPFIAVNCAFDRANMRYGEKMDDVMFSIARVLKELSVNYKIKCYIHCAPDEIVCRYLDQLGVPYEKVHLGMEMEDRENKGDELSAGEYLRYFTEPELVLAIRGHAQMIPFGCKTPVVSMISHDKLQWFLDDIGHPEWGVEVLDEHFEEKLLEKSLYMLAHREEICRQIEEAQEKLWDIMQENLKQIEI